MKKAFTLSEALVTLAIIGVLAAILIPVINNARPDKDKIVYKKALYSLQTAVANAMNSAYVSDGFGTGGDTSWAGGNNPGGDTSNISNWWGDGSGDGSGGDGSGGGSGDGSDSGGSNSFCKAVADSLNIAGGTNCSGTSSYDNPNFITTDGIRYWGLEDDSEFSTTDGNGYKDIYVDRNVGKNERKSLGRIRMKDSEITSNNDLGMKIRVKWDGKVFTPDDDSYGYENGLIEQSLDIIQK
ncbi:MAG: type II secretion system protein [Candidatus Avigastranaerophilus sp.]